MFGHRKGASLLSSVVGVAWVAVVGGAAFTFVTGQTPCSLIGACDTGAGASAPVVTAAAFAEDSTCSAAKAATAETCSAGAKNDKTASANWALSPEGVVVMPAALLAAGADGRCSKEAAAESCDKGATVVNAANTEQCSKTAATETCGKGATVVNAAFAAPAAEQCSKEGAAETCDKGATVVNAAFAAPAAEQCSKEEGAACDKTAAIFAPVNATCPGSGNAIDTAVTTVSHGFTVGFCCNGCKGKFEAQPAAEQAAYIVQHASVLNDTCPTCPTMKPDGASVSLFNGFAVGFCGAHCQNNFESKDDAGKTAYIATQVAAINTACPGSGEPVAAGVVSAYRGQMVGFCCNGCKSKFDAKTAEEKDAAVLALAGQRNEVFVKPAANTETCPEGKCADEKCAEACAAKKANTD